MKFDGIRVLDLSNFMPGPYLTLAMADHGAEVIKVEMPGEGDPARHIAPLYDGVSTFFRNFNRGKKSIVLNLKDEQDRAGFLQLAESADVIVESFRPGVVDRLGVGYDVVSERNPGIIYCSISAFGQDGPYAGRAAHDLAIEAVSGVLSMNLGPDGQPVLPALPSSDVTAGLQGLAGVAMALFARERSGKGDYIDISMHDTLVGAVLNIVGPALEEKRQPVAAHGRTTGGAAFYNLYRTSDGRQLALAGQERKFVTALLGALNRPDLVDLCDKGPGPHQQPVRDFLAESFAALTLAEAGELLTGLDVCWGAVNSLVEALDDPHLEARGLILEDRAGRRHIGPPIRFRNEPAQPDLRVPMLGQDAALLPGSS